MGEQYPGKERIKLNIVTRKPRTQGEKIHEEKTSTDTWQTGVYKE